MFCFAKRRRLEEALANAQKMVDLYEQKLDETEKRCAAYKERCEQAETEIRRRENLCCKSIDTRYRDLPKEDLVRMLEELAGIFDEGNYMGGVVDLPRSVEAFRKVLDEGREILRRVLREHNVPKTDASALAPFIDIENAMNDYRERLARTE